jgi:hypothetical protein
LILEMEDFAMKPRRHLIMRGDSRLLGGFWDVAQGVGINAVAGKDGGWRMEDGGWRMEDGKCADWKMFPVGGESHIARLTFTSHLSQHHLSLSNNTVLPPNTTAPSQRTNTTTIFAHLSRRGTPQIDAMRRSNLPRCHFCSPEPPRAGQKGLYR